MCGIAAILRLGDRPIDDARSRLLRMLRAIAHRGPDDAGVHVDDDCALGAVRLAVVDPMHGKQPARGCANRGVVCVYNGELYAFDDVRRALVDDGHAIEGACDTDVVAHLYEKHGDAMVEKMRGMFAFVVWDAQQKSLVVGRDRFGIKPLFYAVEKDALVIASEAKAIFASGLVQPVIDEDALEDLFTMGYPIPQRTMFRGVFALPPGHVAVVDDNARKKIAATATAGVRMTLLNQSRRYFRAAIPHKGAHRSASMKEHAHDLRDALAHATKTHLHADVPVATTLSGGLDSSLVAALASKVAKPSTFSLTFPDDETFDESRSIALANEMIEAEAHAIAMSSSSSAALLPRMMWHTELPLLVPGAIGGLLLAEHMRANGVKVALTGDGADELLGGYDVFRAAKARRTFGDALFRMGASLFAKPRGIVARMRTVDEIERTQRWFGSDPPWFEQWRLVDDGSRTLLAKETRRSLMDGEPPIVWRKLLRDDLAELDPLDAQIAIEIETRLPSWILVISDRSHMAHGVEARVPFLDDDVAALALSIPPAMKMRILKEKAVLREAARGLVPDRIRRRRKQPFMTPIARWFFGDQGAPIPEFVDEALSRDDVDRRGIFVPEAVLQLRRNLAATRAGTVERLQAELVLMLVLQTQLLARTFTEPERAVGAGFGTTTHKALELLESTS